MSQQPQGVDAQKLDPNMKLEQPVAPDLRWHSPATPPIQVAGLAWFAQEKLYRRLPATPKWPVREPVAALAACPAGGQIRFCTDSTRLSIKVELSGPPNMDHMPASGQCGVDCYIGAVGEMRYLRVSRVKTTDAAYEAVMYKEFAPVMRQITLNLPLYQGVREVQLGLDPAARILPPAPYADARRVIFYGTSITQGGCAARPGMGFTNILSRRFDMEFINLGFSGNGKGEPELARHINEIANPALIVLDYAANANNGVLEQTLEAFIRLLREAQPAVPILVLSKIRYATEQFVPNHLTARLDHEKFMKALVARLRRKGDRDLYFKSGAGFLGDDFDECSVDGAHPTDLGHRRIADALTPVLRRLLK